MTKSTGGKALLNFTDAGIYIDVSRSRVYQLVKAGEIKAVHVGRLHKVSVEELDRYIDRLQREQQSDAIPAA